MKKKTKERETLEGKNDPLMTFPNLVQLNQINNKLYQFVLILT